NRVVGDRKTPPARLIANAQQGIAEIFFSTASILHNENLNEEAIIYIQQVLYLNPDFNAAKLMRGTILEDGGRLQEALAAYDAVPTGSVYYGRAQIRKAYVLNNLDEADKALSVLNAAAKEAPELQYQIQLTRGDIHMRQKKYADAADSYTKALESAPAGKQNLWAVYYARGISLERQEKWESAEKDLLKALELEPEQPDVMNYLAYTWITKNQRLDEAKDMLHKAVAARPNDAHIIDSMGWSLYALGDYDGAVTYLERAIELMPVDPTVNDHLGDAYWRLGRKNEARFQWRRALLFNPEAEQVEELNKKLADGLPEVGDQSVATDEETPSQHAEAHKQQ
ncbi:MAG: tetratricopeptide repeat protein, partial [Alphaproteobacteria bacterium]|nr:tetratricopeptide repeat protein [Alphaproteobacteria bacterium]